jgi:DNA-directed RNA polymerase II subunit RPB4
MYLLILQEYKTNHQVQEEDATKLQFGEFADGEALTLTDVQALLLHARSVPGAPPPPDNK